MKEINAAYKVMEKSANAEPQSDEENESFDSEDEESIFNFMNFVCVSDSGDCLCRRMIQEGFAHFVRLLRQAERLVHLKILCACNHVWRPCGARFLRQLASTAPNLVQS
jgi:hypothetical protein